MASSFSSSQISMSVYEPPIEEDFFTQSLHFGAQLQSTFDLDSLKLKNNADVRILEYHRKKKQRRQVKNKLRSASALCLTNLSDISKVELPEEDIPKECQDALQALDSALELNESPTELGRQCLDDETSSQYMMDDDEVPSRRKYSSESLYDYGS